MRAPSRPIGTVTSMDRTARLTCTTCAGDPVDVAEVIGAVYRGEAEPADFRLDLVRVPPATGAGTARPAAH